MVVACCSSLDNCFSVTRMGVGNVEWGHFGRQQKTQLSRKGESWEGGTPFQLLKYQLVWWMCRFDTQGKLVNAHRAMVPTTRG